MTLNTIFRLVTPKLNISSLNHSPELQNHKFNFLINISACFPKSHFKPNMSKTKLWYPPTLQNLLLLQFSHFSKYQVFSQISQVKTLESSPFFTLHIESLINPVAIIFKIYTESNNLSLPLLLASWSQSLTPRLDYYNSLMTRMDTHAGFPVNSPHLCSLSWYNY